MNSIIEVKDNSLDELIKDVDVFLLKFEADWCGPCRMMTPVINQLANEKTEIMFIKINVDENPELAVRYGIRSIPALLLINKEGKILMKQIGAIPKNQLEEKINNSLK